jgi:hypothetical protein
MCEGRKVTWCRSGEAWREVRKGTSVDYAHLRLPRLAVTPALLYQHVQRCGPVQEAGWHRHCGGRWQDSVLEVCYRS